VKRLCRAILGSESNNIKKKSFCAQDIAVNGVYTTEETQSYLFSGFQGIHWLRKTFLLGPLDAGRSPEYAAHLPAQHRQPALRVWW